MRSILRMQRSAGMRAVARRVQGVVFTGATARNPPAPPAARPVPVPAESADCASGTQRAGRRLPRGGATGFGGREAREGGNGQTRGGWSATAGVRIARGLRALPADRRYMGAQGGGKGSLLQSVFGEDGQADKERAHESSPGAGPQAPSRPADAAQDSGVELYCTGLPTSWNREELRQVFFARVWAVCMCVHGNTCMCVYTYVCIHTYMRVCLPLWWLRCNRSRVA